MLTFQIAALAGHDAWVIVEPQAPRRVIRGCAAALDARQRVDTQIAARLAAGWVPVDRWPAGVPPAPLPPDLVVQMRRLLEVLASAREALQAADPRGRLWAACALFLHQARRFGVASPRPRLARAARERRLGELAEQAGDRPAAIFYYRAALAAYPRVGVTRRLARLEGLGPAAPRPDPLGRRQAAGAARVRAGSPAHRRRGGPPIPLDSGPAPERSWGSGPPARFAREEPPMNGRVQIVGRLPVELSRRVRAAAKRQHISLNAFLIEALTQALGSRRVADAKEPR